MPVDINQQVAQTIRDALEESGVDFVNERGVLESFDYTTLDPDDALDDGARATKTITDFIDGFIANPNVPPDVLDVALACATAVSSETASPGEYQACVDMLQDIDVALDAGDVDAASAAADLDRLGKLGEQIRDEREQRDDDTGGGGGLFATLGLIFLGGLILFRRK